SVPDNSDWDQDEEGAVGVSWDQDKEGVSWDEDKEGAVGGTIDRDSSGIDDSSSKKTTSWCDDDEDEKENWKSYPQNDNRKSKNNNKKPQNQGKQEHKVKEVSGDLFAAPKDNSLAHCVAADMRMGSGIAVTFKRDFKNQAQLLDQRRGVGEVAILEDNDRYIYYLITKKYSTGKPRGEDLKKSLMEMKDHCVDHGVKKLSMPRIGCGLDRLEWRDVKPMIEEVFVGVDISITVYNWNSDNEDKKPPNSKSFYKTRIIPLVDIERETGLVFFGSEDGNIDECGKMLDRKYDFSFDYRKQQKHVGTVQKFVKKQEYIYGLVVKKKESDPLSYVNLEQCLTDLKKKIREDKTEFIGFQAYIENNDELAFEKFMSLVRTVFFYSPNEIHLCYPKELEHLLKGNETQRTERNYSEETAGKREFLGDKKKNINDKKRDAGKNWREK
ncbi:hypothetical protein L9F63_002376, partial [Diploptera punctata]